MIDHKWLKAYAYKVKKCPKCKLWCFALIFDSKKFGQEWECAESDCGYNPHCIGCKTGWCQRQNKKK